MLVGVGGDVGVGEGAEGVVEVLLRVEGVLGGRGGGGGWGGLGGRAGLGRGLRGGSGSCCG